MGIGPRRFVSTIDAVDATVSLGVGCIVAGVAWRYDLALALIVFGAAVGVLALRQQQVRAAIKNPISYLLKGS